MCPEKAYQSNNFAVQTFIYNERHYAIMALNQTNKLVWIVETIYRARKISFEELNHRWMDNVDLSGGEEMLKRTFHKWKWNIFDTFGLSIDCEKAAPYRYYIANVDDMKSGSIEKWLLSTLSVSNSLLESKSIKDRIILEDVPSGREYLEPIIDAMKKNRFIHINYFNYWNGDTRDHYVMPLCVKLFRQRWYMVGRNWPVGRDIVFCLDRIRDFRLSSHSFEYPEDFDPQEYFNGCIGVIPGDDCGIEKVKIKVSVARQTTFVTCHCMSRNKRPRKQMNTASLNCKSVPPSTSSKSCFGTVMIWKYSNRSGSARK